MKLIYKQIWSPFSKVHLYVNELPYRRQASFKIELVISWTINRPIRWIFTPYLKKRLLNEERYL